MQYVKITMSNGSIFFNRKEKFDNWSTIQLPNRLVELEQLFIPVDGSEDEIFVKEYKGKLNLSLVVEADIYTGKVTISKKKRSYKVVGKK